MGTEKKEKRKHWRQSVALCAGLSLRTGGIWLELPPESLGLFRARLEWLPGVNPEECKLNWT